MPLTKLPFILMLVSLMIFSTSSAASKVKNDEQDQSGSLLTPSNLFTTLGPTRFPRPTDRISSDAKVVLEPTFGKHRTNQDAVFAYAEGYDLVHYLNFVQTLLDTGFHGDVVLAISALDDCADGVVEFLQSCQACVIYATDFFRCSDDGFESSQQRMVDNGGKMSFQMCKLDYIYGVPNAKTGELEAVPDPRKGRVVATSRYELYWCWASHYQANSWIMLLDARDAYFQTNPFQNLPRSSPDASEGLLYFYGENPHATRLGKSPKNRKWLERAYGDDVLKLLQDKPTICSGSTLGEQVAMDQYLRAMINEWDETHVLQKGADQGFHNYLYYSNKLLNVQEIRSISVFEQGRGVINNLGALRDTKLRDLGLYSQEDNLVRNWDGSVSPVVHQWDRDRQLYHYTMDKRFPAILSAWQEGLAVQTK